MTTLSFEGRLKQILDLPKEEAYQKLIVLFREREAIARTYTPQQISTKYAKHTQEQKLIHTLTNN